MKTEKKNLRRISIVVTAQTKGNLERLAAVCGYSEIGRVVDKLTREKMISLHDFERSLQLGWSGERCSNGTYAREQGGYQRQLVVR